MEYNYKNILNNGRERKSSIERKNNIEEFYSDRSRIIYCSAFRRLQQKAQVFSLEPNASVRTRLTHSLEVADLGRTMARRIETNLLEKNIISPDESQCITAIVENACLLHDIGNPPFGHFGEAAIKEWAVRYASELPADDVEKNDLFTRLMEDFKEFDGNPQGFRTITKLYTEHDKHSLNLTYATLLSCLKYTRAAGEELEENRVGIKKKAGYFQSEKDLVEKIWETVNIKEHHRYPLTYIMEAADDIAYCMSDIADGIEKNIISEEFFCKAFSKEWKKAYKRTKIPVRAPKKKSEYKGFNIDISIPWSRFAMDHAVTNFIENHDKFYNGENDELISENSDAGKVLKIIKKVSRKHLYTSIQAENIELSGYAVIMGILQSYEKMLRLPYNKFSAFIAHKDVNNAEVERRLFNRIGARYVEAYKFALKEYKKSPDLKIYEWWLRTHMLIDHISGMTDEFALETYQMLKGINLMRI